MKFKFFRDVVIIFVGLYGVIGEKVCGRFGVVVSWEEDMYSVDGSWDDFRGCG